MDDTPDDLRARADQLRADCEREFGEESDALPSLIGKIIKELEEVVRRLPDLMQPPD